MRAVRASPVGQGGQSATVSLRRSGLWILPVEVLGTKAQSNAPDWRIETLSTANPLLFLTRSI